MRILITGLGGTLGPEIATAARDLGWSVAGWDRRQVDPDDEVAGQRLLESLSPDAIVHLALGSEAWAERLAAYSAGRIPLVFVSTAMVFHHQPDGPHRVSDAPTAQDDYGRFKLRCERLVGARHPGATIARIGWQIDPDAPGNNMLAALDRWQRDRGVVEASRRWTPACSFMDDTARALLALVAAPRPGLVHLDANALEAFSFDRIVLALQQRFRRDHWVVQVSDRYRHDQRLLGDETRLPRLSTRLPALERAPS